MKTTIKVTAKNIRESLKVRCDLANAASPVEVDYLEGNGWESTQYQCGSTRHTIDGLAGIGEDLLNEALQEQGLECEWEKV